ncbi:MAG: hypothetical protein NUV51_10255, partial [Sulfuricaulis sp.]|nr:hypothetical protein [Sulfuricaulis sp.]
ILAIVGGLLWAYGHAQYESGYQTATLDQRAAADKIKKDAEDAKAISQKRITALGQLLADKSTELEKVKTHALKTDPTYQSWRATRVHPVAVSRIWGVRDPPVGDSSLRTSRSGAAGEP